MKNDVERPREYLTNLFLHRSVIARRSSIQMPLDILEQLAKRYDMNPSDLIRPYVVGVLNGLRERK